MLPGGTFPSANGGQFWLLRMGLFELQRPKEPADDWVWLIDHTIQTGHGKCFVVFAVRVSRWKQKIADALAIDRDASVSLEHQDLSVWMIERINSSNGVVVCQQLERLSAETGIIPCCILSDQGADVRNGGEQFCQAADRPTVLVHDIAHAVANALKRQLDQCPRWTQFIADANRSKTKIRQTPCAFLMPPELKSKARWMNLETLVAWSGRVLAFLDNPHEALTRAQVVVDVEVIEEKMGWLRGHTESIAQWTTMMEAASSILKFVRRHGYHLKVPQDLQTLLSGFIDGPARGMVEEVLEFVGVQSLRAGEQPLPGSSEVLESLIGKGKQLMGCNKNGYTKAVLGMAAAVMNITVQTIHSALSTTKVRDVQTWINDNIGISLQAQRQRALCHCHSGTKPG